MSQGIEDIKKSLDISKEETKKRIVVQYGADLYNLHDKFMAQGYITRAVSDNIHLVHCIIYFCKIDKVCPCRNHNIDI